MSKKKKIIWILVIVALVLILFFIFRPKKSAVTYTTEAAQVGPLVQTVSSTGDLTDEREITLNFEIGGRIGTIFVREGQTVAAGDSIAMIDNPILNSQLTQAQAAWDAAVAKSGGNDDAIREMEVSVENAEDFLDDTKDLNEENLAAAETAKDNAKDYYEAAQDYYDQIVDDSGEGSSTAKYAYLSLQSALNAYESAQKNKEVAESQADLSKTSAENALNSAEAKLKTLKSKYTQTVNDASVLSAKAAYEIAQENLAKATLKSPVNGKITKINNKTGEVLGTGVIKESFTKVIANDFILESNIPESDIVKVSLGDKAQITFDALDLEDVFSAEVVQIDTDATIIQDVVYYRVKLKIEDVSPKLKPGMSVNVDIVTAQKDNVVQVPSRAIKLEGKRKYVEVLQPKNEVERIWVETGLEGDEGMVEIISGLSGGEEVITFSSDTQS